MPAQPREPMINRSHSESLERETEFREGDRVYAKDFTSSSQKWIVAEVNGPLSYKDQVD